MGISGDKILTVDASFKSTVHTRKLEGTLEKYLCPITMKSTNNY